MPPPVFLFVGTLLCFGGPEARSWCEPHETCYYIGDNQMKVVPQEFCAFTPHVAKKEEEQ